MTISKSKLRRWAHQMPLLAERGFTIKEHKGVDALYKPYEIAYVAWEQVEELMDEEEHKKFGEWISSQTSITQGCYPHDLERFLEGKSSFRY